jgi:hypothetical protein
MAPCTANDFETHKINDYNFMNKFCPDWKYHAELLIIKND